MTIDFKTKLKALIDDPKCGGRVKWVWTYLGPHLLLPLLAIVLLDYAKTLAWLGQVAITAWMMVSLLGFGVGLFVALTTKIRPDSHWAQVRNYKLWEIFPTARWGDKLVTWALEEVRKPEEPAKVEAQPMPEEPSLGDSPDHREALL